MILTCSWPYPDPLLTVTLTLTLTVALILTLMVSCDKVYCSNESAPHENIHRNLTFCLLWFRGYRERIFRTLGLLGTSSRCVLTYWNDSNKHPTRIPHLTYSLFAKCKCIISFYCEVKKLVFLTPDSLWRHARGTLTRSLYWFWFGIRYWSFDIIFTLYNVCTMFLIRSLTTMDFIWQKS